MTTLVTRPPRRSRGARWFEAIMLALMALMLALFVVPLAVGWFTLDWEAVALVSGMVLMFVAGSIVYQANSTLNVTATHLEFSSAVLPDWRVSRSEIVSITIEARHADAPPNYWLWIGTAGRRHRLTLFAWYRLDRDPDSQGIPFFSSWQVARLRALAERSALVDTLREAGYVVENTIPVPKPDNVRRTPAGIAVATLALIAAGYALFRVAIEPYAFLGMPPWWFVAGCVLAAAAAAFAVLRAPPLRRTERVGVAVAFAACVGLLAWAMAPSVNLLLSDGPSEYEFRLVDEEFVGEPGLPALPIGHADIGRFGWVDGDLLRLRVVRGALGAQYELASAQDRIVAGPERGN